MLQQQLLPNPDTIYTVQITKLSCIDWRIITEKGELLLREGKYVRQFNFENNIAVWRVFDHTYVFKYY